MQKSGIPLHTDQPASKTESSFYEERNESLRRENTPQKSPSEVYKVEKIIDGDTFWAADERGAKIKVRLIGIDAPETRNSAKKKKGYFGVEAKNCLAKMIGGSGLYLETDVQRLDRYGRLLAYVYTDKKVFVNLELVRHGCAVVSTFPPNVKFAEFFRKAQQNARAHRRGLWAR